MNKFVIDYGFGSADFYTESLEPNQAKKEFLNAAGQCFGIRKSIAKREIIETYKDVDLPIPFRNKGATHFLSHNGDHILFKYLGETTERIDLRWWKLMSEYGDWCSCHEIGIPELSCSVHHFWVENHDEICNCLDKGK